MLCVVAAPQEKFHFCSLENKTSLNPRLRENYSNKHSVNKEKKAEATERAAWQLRYVHQRLHLCEDGAIDAMRAGQ